MREGQRIKASLTGDWALAQKAIQKLSPLLKEAYRQSQRNIGRQLMGNVKAHIRNQDLDWKPLSEKTIKRKGHQDALIDSNDYYDAIKVHSSGPYSISVGVKTGSRNSKGVDIAMYAAIQEFGHTFSNGTTIPKRPLWSKSWAEMGGKRGMALAVAISFAKIAAANNLPYTIDVLKTKSNVNF